MLQGMISMCDSSQNSSPSLISKLRQFRFQKKQPTQETVGIPSRGPVTLNKSPVTPAKNPRVPSRSSVTPINSANSSPLPSLKGNEIVVIPETPESERPISINSSSSEIDVKNSQPCESPKSEKSAQTASSTTASDIETFHPHSSVKRVRNAVYSDSDNDSQQNDSVGNTPKRQKTTDLVDSELLSDKERCLRCLLDTFPHADIMEMQDILVSCGWDVEKAINCLKRGRGPKENRISVKKSELDSDSDEGHANRNVSRAKTYANASTGRRSKASKVVISDESDSETVAGNTKQNDICLEDLYQLKPEVTTSSDSQVNKINRESFDKTLVNKIRKGLLMKESSDEDGGAKASVKMRKKKKLKKIDLSDDEEEEYNEDNVYDSDASDEDDTLTPARASVLAFFQEASSEELMTVPGCSKKKVDAIQQCRPFSGWPDLVHKCETSKYLTPDLLNNAKTLLNAREAIVKLMRHCQRISDESCRIIDRLMEEKDDDIEGYIKQQPSLLNNRLHLAPYQLLGLNWLLLMHKKKINGILADEMGLGKTIQAIAFIAQLKEQGEEGPVLIVVPSSTLDNWQRELYHWFPSATVLCYHGSQEDRRLLRYQILNDEVEDFDVLVTTYTMVASSSEDRNLFKNLEFNYVIFDEAHMLKNMKSQRYQYLMRIKAYRRLLLTGTPLQNNLSELMSLLIFVMPDMFVGKIESVQQMFFTHKNEENHSKFERERIEQAKRIMKPFFLRRLKTDVLKQLPAKHDETRLCPMDESQQELYQKLVIDLSTEVRASQEEQIRTSGAGMMMNLRKLANHPLLLRNHYTNEKLQKLSGLMLKEPTHCDAVADIIFEDMQVMSDFELHKLCCQYKSVSEYRLSSDIIVKSGKFQMLDKILPGCKEKGDRVLLFSQFTIMLDIVEKYMTIRGYNFLRMDGSYPVQERQQLIDKFNESPDIFVFLLSTRAGGLGINLTAANAVIIHDIDFNPYNDKQAEDRCHRVGQTREVNVIRMISQNTIEEDILRCAQEKLKLERDVTANDEENVESAANVLRSALKL